MNNIIIGFFSDSKKAGEAVTELKEKGYTKEISVLTQDKQDNESRLHKVKQDVTTGTVVGATVGTVTGVLAGVFSGISMVVVPGVGLLVGGPLATILGVTGGAIGSLTGGLIGALMDLGINEPTAKLYEQRIKAGEVLVGISTDESTNDEILTILNKYQAAEINTINRS